MPLGKKEKDRDREKDLKYYCMTTLYSEEKKETPILGNILGPFTHRACRLHLLVVSNTLK